MKTPVTITGVHLYRRGLHAIVAVEVDGVWIEVIKESYDNAFSHIVEGTGILSAKERQQ